MTPEEIDAMIDLRKALAAKSDQINADDLVSGARIVKVVGAKKGEPVCDLLLEDEKRVWRPCKTVGRVLAACWGNSVSAWIGQSAKIYCEPSVKYAGAAVGGIRVEAVTGIDSPKIIKTQESRGKRVSITIQPLKIEAQKSTQAAKVEQPPEPKAEAPKAPEMSLEEARQKTYAFLASKKIEMTPELDQEIELAQSPADLRKFCAKF
jgi:hypothetical protein